jgi:hypothetical protein
LRQPPNKPTALAAGERRYTLLSGGPFPVLAPAPQTGLFPCLGLVPLEPPDMVILLVDIPRDSSFVLVVIFLLVLG